MPASPETVDMDFVAPRYLAGGGDPAQITVPLHRAGGWSHRHDPLMPRVILISPDQKTMLRIDPDQPWWSVRHARIGDWPAWSMRFDARTPVEIIAAVTDTLTDPATASDPSTDPYEPLRLAGWRDGHDHDGLTSPDGIAHVEHFTDSGSNCWFARALVSEDPEGLIWQAYFDGNTPPHLIAAFTRALADKAPLPRDPLRLPPSASRCIRRTTHQLPADAIAFALDKRVADLAARHAGITAPPPVTRLPKQRRSR